MADSPRAPTRSASRWWYLLLLAPFVALLWPPFYAKAEPRLGGWPFFYWFQLVLVALGVICTSAVYLATRRSRREREAAVRAARGEGV
jgi:hypothetical protein